jgi:hypothetical protein
MMSKSVRLCSWTRADQSSDDYLDIDWPRVHRELGLDCVSWLQQLPKVECQLVVESSEDLMWLTAEFYTLARYKEFFLLWHDPDLEARSAAR